MNEHLISVITTSYNCEKYIEETIMSVVSQQHSAQYIVIDAASTDSTLNIINKYKDSIDTLVSEPDKGMYHGIQKGASYVRGEIMSWLNADDIYHPWTFSVVEEIFKKFPNIDWIIGQPSYINEKGQCIKISSNAGTAYPNKYIRNGWFRPQFTGYLQQESMFWRKSLWDKVGGLNLENELAADFELWTRFSKCADLYSVATPLSSFRLRPGEQQSVVNGKIYHEEVRRICDSLEHPGFFWRMLSNYSTSFRVLLRLMIWKKSKFIIFSAEDSSWVIKEKLRPVSRYSISEILSEL